MPNRPIEFKFDSDVTKLLRGLDKAEISVEDLQDAIKKLPKASDKAADDAARDFDRFGDSARDSAREAGKDAGDEFRQNLGESLASGNLEDMFADTLGGLVGSMSGPIGLGVAAVGGAALAVFNSVKQHAEDMKAAIETTFTSMWDNVVSQTGDAFGKIQAEVNVPALVSKEFTRLWEEEPEGMKTLVEQAEKLGIAAGDIVMARAGDEAAIGRVKVALDKAVAGTGMNIEGARRWNEEIGGVADAIDQGEQGLSQAKSTADAYNRSVEGLPAVWGSVQDAIDKVATSTEGVVDEAKKAKLEAADINLDGFLDDTEIAKAALWEIDGIQFKQKTLPVKFNFSDQFWAKQFSDPTSTYYNPGHAAIADSYRRERAG